jgi:hypothetical protein
MVHDVTGSVPEMCFDFYFKQWTMDEAQIAKCSKFVDAGVPVC